MAYHGSPHSFSKFEMRPRTGEGAMAFGHGLYFTDKADIAKTYVPRDYDLEDVLLGAYNKYANAEDYTKAEVFERAMMHDTGDEIAKYFKDPDVAPYHDSKKVQEALSELKEMKSGGKGALYKVTLHKGKKPSEYDYLKWDEIVPSSELKKVERAIGSLPLKQKRQIYESVGADGYSEFVNGLRQMEHDGGNLYNQLSTWLGGDEATSDFLLRAGIDGIDYPAGTLSGGTGKGARNYVVFDPNAVTIENTERGAAAIKLLGAGAAGSVGALTVGGILERRLKK